MEKEYKYDVAISFAEEDRNAALALALALEISGFRSVYYYPDRRIATWGNNLKSKLVNIYSKEARYVIVLLSKQYFSTDKIYTKIELQAIEERVNKDINTVYVLPVVMQKAFFNMPDWLLQLGYLSWDYNPKEVSFILKTMLGEKIQKIEETMHKNGISIKGSKIIRNNGNGNVILINSNFTYKNS